MMQKCDASQIWRKDTDLRTKVWKFYISSTM